MKTLVVYYSYSGSTRSLAQERAEKESADLYEIKDVKRPGTIKAYTSGSMAAMGGKTTEIKPVTSDFRAYEKIIVMSPVWAGNPTPAVNNVFDLLPEGKDVEIVLVSASGKSSCQEKLSQLVESKGCRLTQFTNVKKGSKQKQ